MTQADLNRAVAIATGETVETIARQGFGFVEMPTIERDPLVFDWDDHDAQAPRGDIRLTVVPCAVVPFAIVP